MQIKFTQVAKVMWKLRSLLFYLSSPDPWEIQKFKSVTCHINSASVFMLGGLFKGPEGFWRCSGMQNMRQIKVFTSSWKCAFSLPYFVYMSEISLIHFYFLAFIIRCSHGHHFYLFICLSAFRKDPKNYNLDSKHEYCTGVP